jgi:hypothetical protein
MAVMSTERRDDLYAFDATLHRLPDEPVAGPPHADTLGTWPTLAVEHAQTVVPLRTGFDDAFMRLAKIDRMFVEPDGSFVWTSPREGLSWQVDGNAFEKDGRVLLVDLKGSCPPEAFDRLLTAFGWPAEAVMVQLVKPAVFLDEATFRRHAAARGAAGDGETLRPR